MLEVFSDCKEMILTLTGDLLIHFFKCKPHFFFQTLPGLRLASFLLCIRVKQTNSKRTDRDGVSEGQEKQSGEAQLSVLGGGAAGGRRRGGRRL